MAATALQATNLRGKEFARWGMMSFFSEQAENRLRAAQSCALTRFKQQPFSGASGYRTGHAFADQFSNTRQMSGLRNCGSYPLSTRPAKFPLDVFSVHACENNG